MQTLRALTLLPSVLALALAGCGGGNVNPPPPRASLATGLVYTDPAGTGWRLVMDASSTDEVLVLNLVGPSGVKTRGVGFNVSAPGPVKFRAFASGLPIRDLGVYELLRKGSTDSSEPVALIGGVKPGNLLSVGIYQKDRDWTAKDSGAALCQISLSLDASKGVAPGTTLELAVVKARAIPEDIGRVTDDLWSLDQKMRMTNLDVAVGTLSAK